jgi:DNA-binding response OmpR family regulator
MSAATAEAHCLWEAGHSVIFADTGEGALTSIMQNTFDLILVDYDLPDITGTELFNKIKQNRPKTPVIMITGKGDENSAATMLRAGAKDYLVKSSSLLQNLAQSVDRVLEENRLCRELEAKEDELRRAHSELEQKVAERTAELFQINQKLEAEIQYRRRAETAMLEANQRLLTLMDSVQDGFVSIDADCIIGYHNAAVLVLFDLNASDLAGRLLYEVLPELESVCPANRLKMAISDNKPYFFEIKYRSRCANFYVRLFPQAEGATLQFQKKDFAAATRIRKLNAKKIICAMNKGRLHNEDPTVCK